MRPKAIVWTERQHSTAGVVGGAMLFSYAWALAAPRGTDKPWTLRASLPGFKEFVSCASPEACKATAERILAGFLAKVTEEEPAVDVALIRSCIHRSAILGDEWVEVRGGAEHAHAIEALLARRAT